MPLDAAFDRVYACSHLFGAVTVSTGMRRKMTACAGASTAGSKTDEETTVANSNNYPLARVA